MAKDKIEIVGLYLVGQKNTWELFVELPNGQMKKAFDASDVQDEISNYCHPKGLRDTPDQSPRWLRFLEKYKPVEVLRGISRNE